MCRHFVPLVLAIGLLVAPEGAAQLGIRHHFERHTIIVGIRDSTRARGLQVAEASDEPQGFAVDVTREAAKAVGLMVQFRILPMEDPATVLREGELDAFTGISINEERLRDLEFTAPILVVRGAIFGREGSTRARTLESLRAGRVVAAELGAGHQWCAERGVPVTVIRTLPEALQAVAEGRADYCISTQVSGRVELARLHMKGIVDWAPDDEQFWRAFAICVAKGNSTLLADLNNGLAAIRDNGVYDRLHEKWLSALQPTLKPATLSWSTLRWILAIIGTLGGSAVLWHFFLHRELARRARGLRDAEAGLRAVADALPALVYSYFVGDDGSRSRRFVNSNLAEWIKTFPSMDPGASFETTIHRDIHPEDFARYQHAASASRRAHTTFDLEYRLRSREGEWRWVHAVVRPVKVQGGVLWHAVQLDVTQVRRAADQSRENSEVLSTIASSLEDSVIWLLDRRLGKLLYASPTYERVVGVHLDDELADAAAWRRTIHPDDRDSVIREIERRDAERGPLDLEYRIVHPDGRVRWIRCKAFVVKTAEGDPDLIAGIFQDITEKHLAAGRARELERKLHQSLRLESLGMLAGGIAHDFNNLLVVVMGNAGMAKQEIEPESPAYARLEAIALAAKRASELTRELLAYAGRSAFHRAAFDLVSLTAETMRLLQVSLPPNVSITLRKPAQGSRGVVDGDPTQVRQVVMNLLTNAIDATRSRGGVIVVSITDVEMTQEELAPSFATPEAVPGRFVQLEVQDPGVGIEPEAIPRVFDPFFSTKAEGRGLGLSVVLGIVRRHGGAVRIQSTPGSGSVLSVFFRAAVKSPAIAEITPSRGAPRTRILVVDTDSAARELMADVLRDARYEPVIGASIESAASSSECDLSSCAVVILGTDAPSNDSAPALELLRSRGFQGVLIVAGATGEAASALNTTPGVRVLTKPYLPLDVLVAIESALASSLAESPEANGSM